MSLILSITPTAHLPAVDSILESIQDYDYRSIPLCTQSQLLSYSDQLNAIFTNPNKSTFRLDASLLSKLSHLKVICTASTGLNHIDLQYCLDNEIKVISLTEERPTINKITSTAEHAFSLLMSSLRCIPSSYSSVLAGSWDYEPFIGRQLKELTVGVVGYGRLGTLFSHYCDSFGARVLVYDPYSNVPHPRISQVGDIYELFKLSDIVSLHVHFSESTKGLIDKNVLSFAKDDLVLVNTSRGGIVDEEDLLDFLSSHPRAKYATDVLADEMGSIASSPVTSQAKSDPGQFIITPHCAGMTIEGQSIAFSHAASLLKSFLNQNPLS